MKISLYFPELVTIKKYVKRDGKSIYTKVTVPSSSIVEQCESLVYLIRQRQRFKGNDFVNIAGTDFIKVVGNNYKELVSLLIKHKIIKRNKIFLIGLFSMAYCIDDEIFDTIKNHYTATGCIAEKT